MRVRGAGLGSIIGAVGGLLFVEINASGLTGSLEVRILGALAFVVAVVAALRAREGEPKHGMRPDSIRTYWISVAAMIAGFVVGTFVLRAVGRTDLQLAWVVVVVGVHFVPFSRAFDAPIFLTLAAGLVTVAIVGAGLTLVGLGDGPGWTGVAAGFVLLAFALAGVVVRPRGADELPHRRQGGR